MPFWSKKTDAGAPAASAAPDARPSAAASVDKPKLTDASTEPSALTEEERQKAAATSKNVLAAFGEIASMLMRSPAHKHHSLADLEWLVAPAVTTGQFSVAGAQSKTSGFVTPVGAVMWASVSPEVDKRLSESLKEPFRLQPAEWKSGDILWLIDVVGDPKVTRAIIKRLSECEWGGRPVRFRARDQNGAMRVGVLTLSQDGAAPPG